MSYNNYEEAAQMEVTTGELLRFSLYELAFVLHFSYHLPNELQGQAT